MDFGLSDEQHLLRETARRFVADICPPAQAKAWDETHHYPPELFQGFTRLGWTELAFPEDLGGGGGGAAERPKQAGLSACLSDPAGAGVELRKIDTLARHILGTYEMYLDGVEVPKEHLIGPLHGGWKVLLSGLSLERVLISGGYVGAAQA